MKIKHSTPLERIQVFLSVKVIYLISSHPIIDKNCDELNNC